MKVRDIIKLIEAKTTRYTVIIEKLKNPKTTTAHGRPTCPDASRPARPVDETLANMREAIEFHLEGIREDGEPIPVPTTTVIEVAA